MLEALEGEPGTHGCLRNDPFGTWTTATTALVRDALPHRGHHRAKPAVRLLSCCAVDNRQTQPLKLETRSKPNVHIGAFWRRFTELRDSTPAI